MRSPCWRQLSYPYPDGTREYVREVEAKLPPNDWRKNNLRGPSTATPDLDDCDILDGARTKMAIEDLRRLGKQSESFFLAMGYIHPHLAWVAPKKFWDKHDPDKLPVLRDERITPGTPSFALHNNSELTHHVDLIDLPAPWEEETLSTDRARHLMHGYYAYVRNVDA
ncbi:MAG: iduronate-2-sulfatase, partial [Pirellulaceae bacterium]